MGGTYSQYITRLIGCQYLGEKTDIPLRAEGMMALSETLKFNSTLSWLNVQCTVEVWEIMDSSSNLFYYSIHNVVCELGADGTMYLSDALKYNSSITTLILWSTLQEVKKDKMVNF